MTIARQRQCSFLGNLAGPAGSQVREANHEVDSSAVRVEHFCHTNATALQHRLRALRVLQAGNDHSRAGTALPLKEVPASAAIKGSRPVDD